MASVILIGRKYEFVTKSQNIPAPDNNLKFFLLQVYLVLHVHFCSYKWTQRLCLIFDTFTHPNSHINHTAGEIAILGVHLLKLPGLLSISLAN